MKCHEPSTIITPVLVSEFSSCFCFTFGSFLTFGSFFNLWLLWLLWLLLHPHGLRGCGDRLRCRALGCRSLHALHGPGGPCASQRGAQRGDGRIGNLANYYFGNVTSCCYRYIYIDIHTYPGYQTQKVEGGTPLTMQYATSSVVTQWLQRPPSFLHLDIMILWKLRGSVNAHFTQI